MLCRSWVNVEYSIIQMFGISKTLFKIRFYSANVQLIKSDIITFMMLQNF